MITSECIHRMALSAALLVLPLILYCSEITGNPHPEIGSTVQAETVASSVLPAQGTAKKEKAGAGNNPGWYEKQRTERLLTSMPRTPADESRLSKSYLDFWVSIISAFSCDIDFILWLLNRQSFPGLYFFNSFFGCCADFIVFIPAPI
jgi:hypothetical protein